MLEHTSITCHSENLWWLL